MLLIQIFKDCGNKYDVVIGLREEEKHSVSNLRLTVLVYICLGYLLWLIILCSLCFVICAFKQYSSQKAYTESRMPQQKSQLHEPEEQNHLVYEA